MPLSEPVEREPIHTRQVVCRGFRRMDGLWDIEGHLTDVKTYRFKTEERGTLEPGDPVHDMWMRVTVDDELTVLAVEAATERSPYLGCANIIPDFQCLVGLKMRSGWTRAVKERLGGPRGCTHLVELLGPIATTAFQTVFPILTREANLRARADGRRTPREKPALLNMCHIFDSDGDVVRERWPDFYTGDKVAQPEAAD